MSYVNGYILAMEDIIKDDAELTRSQPGYRSSWQLMRKVKQSLEQAQRTMEILIHDEEAGDPDGT